MPGDRKPASKSLDLANSCTFKRSDTVARRPQFSCATNKISAISELLLVSDRIGQLINGVYRIFPSRASVQIHHFVRITRMTCRNTYFDNLSRFVKLLP